MWPALEAEIAKSRQKILGAVSGEDSFALIRGYGNIGDDLIFAGTRRLFSGLRYHEQSILKLDGVEGDLAVVTGGGAWCRTYEDMARNLPEVEKRFNRVIVLPSSFELDSAIVAGTLARTRAMVFARESVSYEQIRAVCRADLAHDTAFFFDYAPFQTRGQGKLLAYRTDKEAVEGRKIPPGNIDISAECETLDEWLWMIARHEEVHTDRAHVLIAGAMMGKRVVYGVSNYHKVSAIVEYSFPSMPPGRIEPVDSQIPRNRLIEAGRKASHKLPGDFHERHRDLELTVVVLSYNRFEATSMALRALQENVKIPFKLLIIDNNSEPEVQAALKEVSKDIPDVEVHFMQENLGCSGGRAFAFQFVKTPYVLLLDNDVEIMPGALEHLLFQFDKHRDAIAVTGTVVFPDGMIHLSGGNHRIEDGVLYLGMIGGGLPFDQLTSESGPCGWVPGTMTLVKMDALRQQPYDLEMRYYYEDLDWCLDVQKTKLGGFYRSAEALGIHHHEEKRHGQWLPLSERLPKMMRFLETLSYFSRKHGVIVEALFRFVPELGSEKNPLSVNSAKLLLELVEEPGPGWVAEAWIGGKLAPLFVVTSDYERYLHNEVETLRRVSEAFKTTRSWKLFKIYWRWRKYWTDLKTRFISNRRLQNSPD